MSETICYHGRRSVDELIAAMHAASIPVALAHRDLSLLHLDRFVSTVLSAADEIHYLPPATDGGVGD